MVRLFPAYVRRARPWAFRALPLRLVLQERAAVANAQDDAARAALTGRPNRLNRPNR